MLGVGEGDLPTPKFIADAAYQSMLAGETFYTHKRGIPELRQALSAYHKRHWNVDIAEERIAVTSAGMNAMIIIMEIAINAGDNMVAVSPVWPNIFATAEIMGGDVRMMALNNDGHALASRSRQAVRRLRCAHQGHLCRLARQSHRLGHAGGAAGGRSSNSAGARTSGSSPTRSIAG